MDPERKIPSQGVVRRNEIDTYVCRGIRGLPLVILGVINQFEFSRMGTEPLLHPLPRFALDRIMPTYVQVYHPRVRQGIYSYVRI